MKEKNKQMEKRNFPTISIVSCVCMLLFSLIELVLFLSKDFVFNAQLVVLTLVLPITMFLIAFFINRAKSVHPTVKKILTPILAFLLIPITLVAVLLPGKLVRTVKTEGVEAFVTYRNADAYVLDHADSISKTKDAECHVYNEVTFLGGSAVTLFCTYSAENYETEKDRLQTLYAFRTEPFVSKDADGFATSPDFEFQGFVFHTVDPDQYEELNFKERMLYIGTNDATHEIAYVQHYEEYNGDYLEWPLDEELDGFCGWQYFRKK